MRFNAPKKKTWWIALVLLLIGGISFLLSALGIVEIFSGKLWWLDSAFLLASAVLYAMATSMKGL